MDKLPRYAQAAVLVNLRQPLQISEIELPETLGVGQVLVKILFSGICGSQIGEIDGVKGEDRYLPHLLGHEGSGTVIAVGPGVKYVSPGDLVVLHWRKGLGIEAAPPVYHANGRQINAGWVTTFNEYAVVSENRCTAIPAKTDPEVAALFGCAVTTGFGVIENNARVRMGESVVVFGSGGVGLNIVQGAALSSAWPIIAVDRFDNRLELAKNLGATHIINSTKVDPETAIMDLLGAGTDHFIDNTGKPEIIALGYRLTKADGTLTLVGVPPKGEDLTIYSLPLHFGKTIIGSHGGESIPDRDIPRYLKLFEMQRIELKGLISNVYPLHKINEAIMDMRSGKASGRVLIGF
jgi:S-(hydroxymethyl)glutathione dehydrogenase/alcohol dehydrogenase